MGICWYCYWGWPKQVWGIYAMAKVMLNGNENPLHYGPSHIVWEDENFNRESVQWCLDNFEKYANDYVEDDLGVVKWSLEELLKLPDEILDPEPEDYDEENPGKYPPPASLVMVNPHDGSLRKSTKEE
jgi:hypothetical protein